MITTKKRTKYDQDSDFNSTKTAFLSLFVHNRFPSHAKVKAHLAEQVSRETRSKSFQRNSRTKWDVGAFDVTPVSTM